jgi:hypothetical protein
MALTDSFLATCRVSINALSELTTFRTAQALTVHTRTGHAAAHNRAYGDGTSTPSPAYNLATAIRATVNALADAAGTLGLLDRASAVTTLTAEYIPTPTRVTTAAEETAELEALYLEDSLS